MPRLAVLSLALAAHCSALVPAVPLRQPLVTPRVAVSAQPTMVVDGMMSRVVQGATQGAVGAVVAAGLSAFTEPVVNRILVQRISVAQSIKELDVAKSRKFFATTLPTNFLKFPFFEAVNAAMTLIAAPDYMKGAITGIVFTTMTLPITNYRFCKSMEMEINSGSLFKAYLPTVLRDIAYGISRNKLTTAMRLAFPLMASTANGRALMLFPVVFGACILSSPGNELRGYFLQPKEKRLGFKAFFKPVNYARSTFAGALIMAISLTTGSRITGPVQALCSTIKAAVMP